MGNPSPVVDFGTPLDTFLATSVSDGTYEDVLNTPKVDAPGQDIEARAIDGYCGQLYSNRLDDFVKTVWENNNGLTSHDIDTTDATLDFTPTILSLPGSGQVATLSMRVTVRSDLAAGGELAYFEQKTGVHNDAGTLVGFGASADSLLVGLAGLLAAFIFSGTDILIAVQGQIGKNLAWTVRPIYTRIV